MKQYPKGYALLYFQRMAMAAGMDTAQLLDIVESAQTLADHGDGAEAIRKALQEEFITVATFTVIPISGFYSVDVVAKDNGANRYEPRIYVPVIHTRRA